MAKNMFHDLNPGRGVIQDFGVSIPDAEQERLVRGLDESKRLDLALTGANFIRDVFRQKRSEILYDQIEIRGRTERLLPEYKALFEVCKDYAILTPSEIELYGAQITEWEEKYKKLRRQK